MITLLVNGIVYTGFTEIEVAKSLDNFCGSFMFAASWQPGTAQLPFAVGSAVQVQVDTKLLMTGIVDKISVEYSSDLHTLRIEGRDKTSDVLDSTSDGKFEIIPPETLIGLTARLLALYHIVGITASLDPSVGTIDPFAATEAISGNVGDPVHEIIERHARLRQVFSITDVNGNILFIRGGSAVASQQLVSNASAKSNVKAGRATYDFSKRFNQYNAWSQDTVGVALTDNPDGTPQEIAGAGITRLEGATDSAIRLSRTLNFISEKSMTGENLTDRATWEANVRRARSIEYVATVQGHTQTGKSDPWVLNTLVNVDDLFCDIRSQLLIKSLKFKQNLIDGTITEIGCTAADAYSLKASDDARKKRHLKMGDKYDG